MKIAMLMYEDSSMFETRDTAATEEYWGAWTSYVEAIYQSGIVVAGQGLQSPATATTMTLRGGTRQVQDGPYADTKEQLGGFFVLEVPSMDEALQWAAKCPAAAHGFVELRPALVM